MTTMDDDATASNARATTLGFKPQKELVYNKLLPYASELDNESAKMFADIKANLGKSVMHRELRPGCGIWSARLARYIQLYGFKFSKEDHVTLVKLMYECVTIPNLEPYLVHKFSQVLFLLLKKKTLLSPSDITLEWRPLYQVVKRIMNSSHTQLGMCRYFALLESTLDSLVHVAKYYFPDTATKEILEESKPNMYPLSGLSNFDLFEWFLPVALPPEKADMGHKLWLADVLDMWSVCSNAPVWEVEALNLIAKLASHNIGYIDWEPYFPDMFNRFLSSICLPVNFKNKQVKKNRKLDTSSIALWIVSAMGGGSSCLKHLENFLKAVESFYHPANFGAWSVKLKELLWKLTQCFIERLRQERHEKPSWMTPVPESHHLTEDDIDRFVECMKPVALLSVFSKLGCADVCVTLQHLATLRPSRICPDLIDRLYLSLDSLTEPHKLTSVLQCIVGVARPLVQGPTAGYKEGPLHVVPLLLATLPGIDPNDFRKCIVTFQFIQTFVTLVPLVDCSQASEPGTNITEEEEELMALTAGFEDFVLQFFDRVFMIVENSSLEVTRLDKNENRRSRVENLAERALSSVCFSVLTQSSPEIFSSALKKVQGFVTGRVLETNVAGHLVASLCSAFSRVNACETFKALLPSILTSILSLTDTEDIQEQHDLDNELLYNLLILSSMVECRKDGLRPYMQQLTAVLDRCLYLVSCEGYAIASRMLANLLMSFTNISAVEHRSLNCEYITNNKNHLLIRDWGKPGNINNVDMTWHIPDEEDVAEAQRLVTRYLLPELERIDKHISGEEVLSKTRLLIALSIISGTQGAESMLPLWDESPIPLLDSCLEVSQLTITVGTKLWLKMPDGRNIRHVIAHTIDRLQRHLLETAQDHTKAFFGIIRITERLLLNKMRSGNDFEGHYKNHNLVKKMLTNQMMGGKQRIRVLLLDRVVTQHEARCEKAGACMTPTHRMLMLGLLSLSCSHYSQIRSRAQAVLCRAVDFFPYSYSVLTPQLLSNLSLDPVEAHDTIKGSLYVILGPKQAPVVARHDWSLLLDLWPALVRRPPSEKTSVIQLMENVREAVNKHYPTITISLDIPNSCIDAARPLWQQVPLPSLSLPTPEDIENGRKALSDKNSKNLQLYHQLLDKLTTAAKDNSIHWRHHSIATSFIRDLVHPDVPYPTKTVQLFLDSFISESLDVRKIAIRSVVFLLKQQKRKHKKVTVALETLCPEPLPEKMRAGFRPDNAWLHYDSKKRPLTAEDWDTKPYHHAPGFGYLHCPMELKLYAPSSEQPKLDRTEAELNDEERPVVEFFSNAKNVQKMVEYLALEEKKGRDKFNAFRFTLFKNLFRNHGDTFLPVFRPHLERLVADDHESSQRCAAEIIAGIIRGSKHWSFEKTVALWENLKPLIETALIHMSEETVQDWGVCFATASQNRDPNRNHWLLECLMEDPLRNETSFMECGRLYVLQSALNQQEWRVSELFQRLLVIIIPYLDHPFENVRRRLSSVLTNIFQPNVALSGGIALGPHVADFVSMVDERLQVLYGLSLSDVTNPQKVQKTSGSIDKITESLKDKLSVKNGMTVREDNKMEAALRLSKTVVLWISGTLTRSNACPLVSYYALYPIICHLESYDQDEELGPMCSRALATLAPIPVRSDQLPSVFAAINKVAESESWWARRTNLDFLQVFLFHSMAVVRNEPQWAAEGPRVVLAALSDCRLEVREKAAEVLAGLIHCESIDNAPQLLSEFTARCGKRGRRDFKDPAVLCARHSAILGLCAFINASPYDVPDYVPELFEILGNHLNDPQPIPSTIRKTLGDFKRTHHDNWENHKLKFSEQQLEVLNDLIVPPSYFT